MIDLIGYHITQNRQYGTLDSRKYQALGYAVFFPSVQDAEDAILRIFSQERRRIEESFNVRQPHPGAAKKTWDDKVGAFAVVQERISDWRVVWTRAPHTSGSVLSNASVVIEVENRIAWREVRQITRTTDAGLEVVHELGEPGGWTDWHRPLSGSQTYLPSLSLDVVPWTSHIVAGKREARAWLARQLEETQ
jgi:hypothetical protein